jgi:carboxypeptidase Taq
MSSYLALRTLYQQIHPLTQIRSVLSWDTRAMMPSGAVTERAAMMRSLDQSISRLLREVPVHTLLEEAATESLGTWDTENLRLMGRDYVRHRIIPDRLAAELNSVAYEGRTLWPQAKANNDWVSMLPVFTRVIEAERKKIKILRDELGIGSYEVCLFDFVRGYSAQELNAIMDTLVRRLSPLVRTRHIPDPVVLPRISRAKQLRVCHELLQGLGFDFNHGRIDVSAKAFHSSTDEDSRIGLRVAPTNVWSTISSAVHEMGHALHKLHRPKAYWGQPVGTPGDFAMREAMAFVWQVHACRTPEFLAHASGVIHNVTGQEITAKELHNVAWAPSRGPIRVGADPLSYMLHIAVRTKIEQELLVEMRDVDTVPERWAELYQEYLGVEVPNDAMGCLQDIHWYKGAFGYFPAYALGHVNAAALMQHAEKEIPTLRNGLAHGNGLLLVDWLERHIYRFANLYSGRFLVEQSTGSQINVDTFIDRLMEG